MNTTEYLLVKLIEELGEVQKDCTKALAFGLHDTYRADNELGLPKWDMTPLQEIQYEMNDVRGVLRLLEGHRDLPEGAEVFTGPDEILPGRGNVGMKRGGFPNLTYDEALERARRYDDNRRLRLKAKPSQAAKSGKRRTSRRKVEHDVLEAEWKRQVRERDDFTCQFPGCRTRHKFIHAHHIAPKSQRKDLKYVVENGICLCFKHHEWVHNNPLKSVPMGLLSRDTYELAAKEGRLGECKSATAYAERHN